MPPRNWWELGSVVANFGTVLIAIAWVAFIVCLVGAAVLLFTGTSFPFDGR